MKKYPVIVTPEAQTNISDAFRYIYERAPLNAERLYALIDTLEHCLNVVHPLVNVAGRGITLIRIPYAVVEFGPSSLAGCHANCSPQSKLGDAAPPSLDSHRYNCLGHAATGNFRRIEARVHSVQARGHRHEIKSQDQWNASHPNSITSAPVIATHFTRRKTRPREGV